MKKKCTTYCLTLILLLFILPAWALGSNANISWEPNAEPDLQGYNLYYGTNSRNYGPPLPVGKTTSYALGDLLEGQTYFFAVTAVDTSGNESGFSAEVSKTISETLPPVPSDISDGLRALWLMDESMGTSLSDASGNGQTAILTHNGTSSNPSWQTDSSQGSVITLDGAGWSNASAGNYVDLGSLDISADQMTIGIMFKASSLDPSDGRLIAKQTGVQDQDHYWMLSRYTNNALRFRLRTDGSVSKLISSPNLYNTNQWVLAVATYDGSQMRIYCNGELVGSLAKSGPIDTNSSIHAFIGAGQDGSNLFTTMDGQVAYAFVYERALSETEIKSIQDSGKGTFWLNSTPADTAAPLVAITTPVSAETYTTGNAKIAIAGTASDDQNLQQVTWTSSNGDSGTAKGSTNWSVSDISLSEGENVITVTAIDTAGNSASDQLRVTYTPQDTTVPEVTITSPVSAETYTTENTTIAIAGTASDDQDLQQITWDSSTGGSGTASGKTNWSIDAIDMQAGTNVITVTATDSSGNQATDSITITYNAANTNNGLSVVSVTSSGDDGNVAANTIDNDLSTRWSASGDGQWIQYDLGASFDISQVLIAYAWGDSTNANSEFEIFVSNNASSWNSVFKGQSSGSTLQQESYSITNATGRFVRIVGYGNANNDWNSVTEVDIVGVAASTPDTTAPAVNILSPTKNGTYETSTPRVQLTGTAVDGGDVAEVTWRNSNGDSGAASGTTNWTTGDIDLLEGSNTITVSARDAAGNQGASTLTVVYTATDTTNPEVNITTPVSTDTYTTGNANIAIAGTASDDQNLQQVTWTSSNGSSGTADGMTNWSASGINLAEGENIITVTATDSAGNSASDMVTVIYAAIDTGDTEAPTVQITTPTTKASYFSRTSTLAIGGTASDNAAIQKIVWQNSRGESGTCNGTDNWQASGIKLNRWWNTITVTAIDGAGNTAKYSLKVFRW